jgi:hypothetical protein
MNFNWKAGVRDSLAFFIDFGNPFTNLILVLLSIESFNGVTSESVEEASEEECGEERREEDEEDEGTTISSSVWCGLLITGDFSSSFFPFFCIFIDIASLSSWDLFFDLFRFDFRGVDSTFGRFFGDSRKSLSDLWSSS